MKSKILDLTGKRPSEVEQEIDNAISNAKRIHSLTFHGTFDTVPPDRRYPVGTTLNAYGEAEDPKVELQTYREAYRAFSGTIILIYDE